MTGKLFVADYQQLLIVKLQGDLRLTLCRTLDEFFVHALEQKKFTELLIDLTDCINLDSTTLGLLAKLAFEAKKQAIKKIEVICPNEDIRRLLESMGLDALFEIKNNFCLPSVLLEELNCLPMNENQARKQVLSAHQALISLNAANKIKFTELVGKLSVPT